MSLRGPLVRLWRRVELECRRRKSLRDRVVILVAVQTIIAVCFITRELQQQVSENKTPEATWRVDQHIVLFSTATAARASGGDDDPRLASGGDDDPRQASGGDDDPRQASGVDDDPRQASDGDDDSRQEPANSEGEMHSKTQATLRTKNKRSQAGKSNVKQRVRQETQDLWGWKERSQQILLRVTGSHHEEDNLENNDNMRKYNQDNEGGWWKEEEDDPDVGRGFQEEFVTYRTDNTIILLNKLTSSDNVQISVVNSSQGTAKQASNPDTEIHRDVSGVQKTISNIDAKNILTSLRNNLTGFGNINNESRPPKDALTSSGTSDYKFKTYNTSTPSKFGLTDDKRNYFQDIGNNSTCFVSGTDIKRSKQFKDKRCHCLKGYFGMDCGIPEAAWFDMYRNKFPDTGLSRREVPRRVINGVPVNHEFALFEARMHELHDVVDVFIIAESNYTAHGDPKDFRFLERFREGYLKDFQDKVVYVPLGFFSPLSKKNGWIADAYIRLYLGEKGLLLLQGLRDDDLFVLSDADELPTKEILTFLKLYDGYPEPISFALRWSVFGFFWLNPAVASWLDWSQGSKEQLTIVTSVATVGMLRELLDDNVFYIRKKNLWQHHLLAKKLRKYRSKGHLVKDWVAGTVGHYAGWHCSWCFSPENMVHKMDSAQAADLPRWGDFPQKRNLTYITSRIWHGIWFDDELRYIPAKNPRDRFYAPRYMLDHPHLYRSILFHPGHSLNLNKTWLPP